MSSGVVYILEVVNIDKDAGKGGPVPVFRVDQLLYVFIKKQAVIGAGELVVKRKIAHPYRRKIRLEPYVFGIQTEDKNEGREKNRPPGAGTVDKMQQQHKKGDGQECYHIKLDIELVYPVRTIPVRNKKVLDEENDTATEKEGGQHGKCPIVVAAAEYVEFFCVLFRNLHY